MVATGENEGSASMASVRDSEPLTDFTADPGRYLERLQQSGQPIRLTQHGRDVIVIQDAASYQQVLEKADRLDALTAVRDGLRDVAEGRTEPMREALAEIARRRGLALAPDHPTGHAPPGFPGESRAPESNRES